MDKTIKALLNGYEHPAILSSAEDGLIVFFNDAAYQKLGIAKEQKRRTKVADLFNSRQVIQQNIIWERSNNKFEINEVKLNINGEKYIHSIVKPLKEQPVLDLVEIQKEMAKLLVHRFHSPLNGVLGFTELLAELDLTDKQARYVEAIKEGLDDFRNILSSINELALDIEVQKTTINVQKFTEEIRELYPPQKRKRINVEIAPGLIQLYSDYVLLKAIITELLDNALEFSPNTHSNIELQFRDGGIIRITSHGSKIPETYSQKMFYPFFSNKARGIGLGLSKCLYYANKMGYELVLSQNSSTTGISFDIVMK